MAKLELTLRGDFDTVVRAVTDEIVKGSMSAELEDTGDFRSKDARCAVRVIERYSFAGSNRVSLSLTFFGVAGEDRILVSAITSGGSQALFFKTNTWGEESFLDKAEKIMRKYQ